MYKGMVLRVTTEYAIVITDDNSYCKITFKEGLLPGQRIYFFEEDKLDYNYKHDRKAWFNGLKKKAIALTVMTASIALFFLFYGVFSLEPKGNNYFAVVSVDINPSVELRLNEEDYVIGVEPLNHDGKKVSGNYLLGLKVDKAVSHIIGNAEKMNYLNPKNDTVLLATALNTTDAGRMQALAEQLSNIQLSKEYSYLIIPMERDDIVSARENKLSIGKYAMLDLAAGSLRAEEVRNMKVKDLLTSSTIEEKLQEKTEKEKEKQKEKKDKDKKVRYKDKDKDVNQQGKGPANPTKPVEQRQDVSVQENPGQGRDINKGKPENGRLKIKYWPQKMNSFLFPKAVD